MAKLTKPRTRPKNGAGELSQKTPSDSDGGFCEHAKPPQAVKHEQKNLTVDKPAKRCKKDEQITSFDVDSANSKRKRYEHTLCHEFGIIEFCGCVPAPALCKKPQGGHI